jgi:exodeoxyribonuclease-3
MKYNLISWNVNGLRACDKKGFTTWLKTEKPDILGVQETKSWPEQLDDNLREPKGYNTYFSCAQKKGYSGVALYIKDKINVLSVTDGLGIEEFDSEGRTLIVELEDMVLFNCYFPNGQRDLGRVPYKLKFSREVAKQALALKKKLKKPVVICGDYNTSHREIDLKNPKPNMKNTGFLPEERAWIDEFISQGFVDVFREQHPDEEGHYTWWSYRSNCRAKNVGWRLDYFFVTDDLRPNVGKSKILSDVLGSDHCPVSLKLK